MIIHQTPGLIDVKAFTTFGVNSKPNSSNPIGYFGTGLKYAIAVLCRHKCNVTLWIGHEPHIFYADKMTFRGKEFLQLRMRRKRGATSRWMSVELPFTTELGKNWDLWMAFRELHANTLDEGGRTYYDRDLTEGIINETCIAVEGDAYEMVYDDRGSIFLSDQTPLFETESIKCFSGSSKHAFYRNLRVYDLQKPSCFTWNVLSHMDLTEDRTLKYPYFLRYEITKAIMTCTDKELIRTVLTLKDCFYEGECDFDSYRESFPMSPEFIAMARLYGGKRTVYIVEHAIKEEARATAVPQDWREELLNLLDGGDRTKIMNHIRTHEHSLRRLLKASLEASKQ